MSELSKIQQQIAQLQAQAEELIKRERTDALAQIRSLMNSYGISAAELGATAKPVPSRKKAEIKFRDPATGKTWSGRGRRPAWVTEGMAV